MGRTHRYPQKISEEPLDSEYQLWFFLIPLVQRERCCRSKHSPLIVARNIALE